MLDALPYDVLAIILAFLPVKDLCVMERTSKSLFQMIRQRHTWNCVVSDIHKVKPLAYHIDLLSMTADDLRATAIRAVKLHHAMSQTFIPKRLARAPLSIDFVVYRMYSYPRGRCIAAGKLGELALFSTRGGCCLDNVTRLYQSTPEELVRDHWTVPVVISTSQAYLFHVVNCEEVTYTHRQSRSHFKEAIIRLFRIEDDTIRLERELCVAHEVISVSASSCQWAYVSWEEHSRSFFVRIFFLSDDLKISSEGVTCPLQFLAKSPRWNPVTLAFVSDRHIMLADYRRICVYLVPDSSYSGLVSEPLWQHLSDPHNMIHFPTNPRVSVASPSPENPNALRFSLFCEGYLRTVHLSLPDSGTVRALDMFLPHCTIYSLGTTSFIMRDHGGKKYYHSISFLSSSSPKECTERLSCGEDTLVVHGDLRLSGSDDCRLPRALCLDEEFGVLVASDFDFIYIYNLM